MITVGVDFHTWSGIYQGSRSHILGIYRRAIVLAPDITFVFFGDQLDSLASSHEEFTRDNVKLVFMSKSLGAWRLAAQLPYLAWRHDVDILHTQYRIPIIAPCKIACTIHDLLVETHREFFPQRFGVVARLMFRFAAIRSDILLTVSRYSKSEIVRLYGIDPERIRVTYNGVEFERFTPDCVNEQVLKKYNLARNGYWLMVGRLEPRKNHLNVIKAWASSTAVDRPLVFVGQPDMRMEEVLAAAADSGLSNMIMFLDDVSDADLPSLYGGCYCFLYPSFAEGFGMPVAEALACGVPVITSSSTSLPEIAGDVASVVDPHQVSSIASALVDITNSEREVSERLAHVRQFDWTKSAGILLESFGYCSSSEEFRYDGK